MSNYVEQLFSLEGCNALVTGGSSGIGLAMAKALSQAGCKVAILNRNKEKGLEAIKEIDPSGEKSLAVAADVASADQVEAAVSRVEDELGPLDILVNSHGINIRKKSLEFSPEEWQKVLDINLTGVFNCCRSVGSRMLPRKSGRIVNISSIASLVGLTERAPYCASKGGVSLLTKTLALEWAESGVQVNAIGPGFIHTPLTDGLIKSPGFDDKVKALVPLGRVGMPEELVGMMLLLCSPAGNYITGQTIYIDGGWSVW